MKQNRVTEGIMRSSSSFLAVFQNAKSFPNPFKPRSAASNTPAKKPLDIAKFLKAFGASGSTRSTPTTPQPMWQSDEPQEILNSLEQLTLPETIEVLEAVSRQVHGQERTALVKVWCSLMQQDGPRISQAPTPDTSAAPSAASSPTNTPRTMKQQQQQQAQQQQPQQQQAQQQQQPQQSKGAHRRSLSLPDTIEPKPLDSGGADVASTTDDKASIPVSFRELFLQSQALEYLLQGYLETPGQDDEEQQAVGELLQLCLLGVDQEQARQLSAAWMKLASAASGTPLSSSSAGSVVVEVASQAITSIKGQAEIEQLDQQIQAVQSQLSSSSDTAAGQPTAPDAPLREFGRWKGAQHTWELTCVLENLSSRRQAILDKICGVESTALLAKLEPSQQQVQEQLVQVTARLVDAQHQIERGTGFRSDKFSSLRGVLVDVMGQISRLEAQKTELLAQLAQVDDELKKLYRRQNLLEEERDVFEEGNSIMLEELHGCLNSLTAAHASCVQEGQALAACGSLVQMVEEVAGPAISGFRAGSQTAHVAAIHKVLTVGCMYCELHCQEVAACLQAMKCAADGIQDIDRELMESILEQEAFDDMQNKRVQLLQRHHQLEAAARAALTEFTTAMEAMVAPLTRLQALLASTNGGQRPPQSESVMETTATLSAGEGPAGEAVVYGAHAVIGPDTHPPSCHVGVLEGTSEGYSVGAETGVRDGDAAQSCYLEDAEPDSESTEAQRGASEANQVAVSRGSTAVLDDVSLASKSSTDDMVGEPSRVADSKLANNAVASSAGVELTAVHGAGFWADRLKQLVAQMEQLKTSVATAPRPRGTFSNITATQMMDNRGSSFLSDSSQPSSALGVQLANTDHVSYSSLMGGMSPELVSPNSHSDPQIMGNLASMETVHSAALLGGDLYLAADGSRSAEEGSVDVVDADSRQEGTVLEKSNKQGRKGGRTGEVVKGDVGEIAVGAAPSALGHKMLDDGLFSPETDGAIKAVHGEVTE